MYILITLFAVSLFLIALLFAIKEREVYKGRETALTRFLRAHSPRAEVAARRLEAYGIAQFRNVAAHIDRLYVRFINAFVFVSRAIVVIIAQRMVRAVRGEKLLSSKRASSMYLKHLKEHKDDTAEGAPQV